MIYQTIIGVSPAMERVRSEVRKAAKFNYKVLILGPSGSGKELVARLIHGFSNRSKAAFIAVNSCEIPKELAESILFGHKKGTFTDAKDQKGKFEEADGGTLMIDEIGDMPLSIQKKLLRALNDSKIVRLGDSIEKSVDVRLITATNQDLKELIQQGKFREDLYYRIAEGIINIPALKDRREDIQPLVEYFLPLLCQKAGFSNRQIDATAYDVLLDHSWPGNIRELQNCITRSFLYDIDARVIAREAIISSLEN